MRYLVLGQRFSETLLAPLLAGPEDQSLHQPILRRKIHTWKILGVCLPDPCGVSPDAPLLLRPRRIGMAPLGRVPAPLDEAAISLRSFIFCQQACGRLAS